MTPDRGTGTIYQRGRVWWVKLHVDGKPVYHSSKSTSRTDAVKLRNKLLGEKDRNELKPGREVLINELLDDVLESNISESTRYIWRLVANKSLRPFFGRIKASALSTEKMIQYRNNRLAMGVTDATVNRELVVLRTAFNNGRKRRTPAKVHVVPHFPLVRETNVRQGFLTHAQYERVREALPEDIRPLFVTAYCIGGRKSELLSFEWDWVDFDAEEIRIAACVTKTGTARVVPIVPGDMREALLKAKQERDANWPDSRFVFSRSGKRITDFRTVWNQAVKAAGVPNLIFHDLRRTAVRNMRDRNIPQVVRMAISGHKTDSMERRYSIVDRENLHDAKLKMATK